MYRVGLILLAIILLNPDTVTQDGPERFEQSSAFQVSFGGLTAFGGEVNATTGFVVGAVVGMSGARSGGPSDGCRGSGKDPDWRGPMSRRRRGRIKAEGVEPPELSGIAKLLSEMPVATLDLHGYTSAQARSRVLDFLTTHSRISAGRVVHLITGKGTGSEGAAVLQDLVREMLGEDVAHQVGEYAGMLGGGGWVVRF